MPPEQGKHPQMWRKPERTADTAQNWAAAVIGRLSVSKKLPSSLPFLGPPLMVGESLCSSLSRSQEVNQRIAVEFFDTARAVFRPVGMRKRIASGRGLRTGRGSTLVLLDSVTKWSLSSCIKGKPLEQEKSMEAAFPALAKMRTDRWFC